MATTKKQSKDTGESLDDFYRKREWFLTGREGVLDLNHSSLLQTANRQAQRLGSLSIDQFAVNEKPKKETAILITQEKCSYKIIKSPNPQPRGSYGFATPNALEVESKEDLTMTRLVIPLAERETSMLHSSSIRMFRWEKSSESWVLIPRSGVSEDGKYAWCVLHRPGVYIPIGLPAGKEQLLQITKLYKYKTELGEARERKVLDKILQKLLTIDELDKFLLDLDEFDSGTNPVLKGHAQNDKKQKAKHGSSPIDLPIELPMAGFPEFQILDDICPPYFRRKPFPWLEAKLILPDFLLPTLPNLPIKLVVDWTSAGPRNFSGRIKSLAIHPSNGNILYAGAADGGIWKTINGGVSWRALMFNELSMAIGSVAVSGSDPNIIYAATGEDTPGWGPSYGGVGVYRSNDEGTTWNLLAGGIGGRCSRILIHSTNPDIVWVGSNAGLYKSIDGGGSWAQTLPGHITDMVIDPFNSDILFASIWNDGVYRSTDGGVTWHTRNGGLAIIILGGIFWIAQLPTGTNAEWIKLAIGRNGAHGSNFLVAKMGTDSGNLYYTEDGGNTWWKIAGTHQPASYNEWTNMVAINPNNHDVIFAGGVGLERTPNRNNFVGIGGTHSDHHALVFDPTNSNICYMATDGGVYRSTDNGLNWTLRSTGLIATQLYSIGVSQGPSFVLGGGTQDQGIIMSTGSSNWLNSNAGNEGGFFIVDPNDDDVIYTTPWSHNLRRTTNGGATWTDIRTGMTEPLGGGGTSNPADVQHLAVQPGNSSALLALGSLPSGGKIFRSVNQGTNWSVAASINGSGTRVAFAASNHNVAYVTTNNGRVYRTANGGTTWAEPYTAANRPATSRINALGVAWFAPNLLYIGMSGYSGSRILRSFDGGQTWADASGVLAADQLPGMPVNSLVVDQFNPDVVYVAMDIGVFRTRDAGVSWENFSDGFLNQDVPRIIVTELSLRRSNNRLYASTMGRGCYRRNL